MYTIGLKKTPEELQEIFQQSFNNSTKKIYELDELYWFIERKAKTETRENIYLMTMISREPRQIISFDVALDKNSVRLQGVVDNAPWAKKYCTDGNLSYLDVIFPGKHIRNVRNKKDTHNVESINADLRHYNQSFKVRSAVRSFASGYGVRFLHSCFGTAKPLFLP